MSGYGEMWLRRDDVDGLFVERADDTILVAPELLLNPTTTGDMVSFDGEALTVTASNGEWRYRREGFDTESRAHVFVKESGPVVA